MQKTEKYGFSKIEETDFVDDVTVQNDNIDIVEKELDARIEDTKKLQTSMAEKNEELQTRIAIQTSKITKLQDSMTEQYNKLSDCNSKIAELQSILKVVHCLCPKSFIDTSEGGSRAHITAEIYNRANIQHEIGTKFIYLFYPMYNEPFTVFVKNRWSGKVQGEPATLKIKGFDSAKLDTTYGVTTGDEDLIVYDDTGASATLNVDVPSSSVVTLVRRQKDGKDVYYIIDKKEL